MGALLTNTSELLALLCAAGVAACLVRWPTAHRRDFLLAFAVFLAGTLGRELVVYLYGASGWTPTAVTLSGLSRVVQIVGSLLFVRASLRDTCGEWGWIVVFIVSVIFASLV